MNKPEPFWMQDLTGIQDWEKGEFPCHIRWYNKVLMWYLSISDRRRWLKHTVYARWKTFICSFVNGFKHDILPRGNHSAKRVYRRCWHLINAEKGSFWLRHRMRYLALANNFFAIFLCDIQNEKSEKKKRDPAQTSAAAIVTVWLVTITGRMFAWLFVMAEKRKIADGKDLKNPWAAAKK